jgi:hypothetical protein
VDGGFPAQLPGLPVCEGEACQGASAGPPVLVAPGSATFNGAGNLTPEPVAVPVKAKPLTRAQKLAKALQACKKDKSKKTRSSCEKQARKRYGAKAKKSQAKRSKE